MNMQVQRRHLRLYRAVTALLACLAAQAQTTPTDPPTAPCGRVISVATHGTSQTRYALQPPDPTDVAGAPITLALLVGGGGQLDLDAAGCVRQLKGNSLVRFARHFQAAGLGWALIDAPSDTQGEDGLAGFRSTPQHAQDLGQVIADIRSRTHGAVWLVGTSRGTLSAANAASRLSGDAAPDGLILTSIVSVGQSGARKNWVAHTVFDLPLENIRMPLLLLGHAEDQCVRSPAARLPDVAARAVGTRPQIVTVVGGPGRPVDGVQVCEGLSPHGYLGQDEEVAAGIVRFVRNGRY